jgi:hypothetical protein
MWMGSLALFNEGKPVRTTVNFGGNRGEPGRVRNNASAEVLVLILLLPNLLLPALPYATYPSLPPVSRYLRLVLQYLNIANSWNFAFKRSSFPQQTK